MTYHAQLSPDGSVVLPAELVRSVGFKLGDLPGPAGSGGAIVLRPDDRRDAAIMRRRAAMHGYRVDQILSERGADWGE